MKRHSVEELNFKTIQKLREREGGEHVLKDEGGARDGKERQTKDPTEKRNRV